MEEEGKSPQFWLHAGHHRSSYNLYTSTLFMLVVPTATLLLLHFTFSSVPSLSSQILNPNSVKKTWDSLNLLLVLFAIFCGTFARWNEDDGGSTESRDQDPNDHQPQQPSFPPSSHELKWYELSSYDSSMRATTSGRGGLRRSSSSYPDLRQQSNWETTGEHGFRYYDDFEIARINQLLEIQPERIVGQGKLRLNADPDPKLNTHPSKQDAEAKPVSLQANLPSSPPPPLGQKKIRACRSVPRLEILGIQNAAGTAHKLPQIENKEGIRQSLETGLRSQAKARRRRKDVPGEERKQKSSVTICTSPPSPPVDVTVPLKDEYLRSASETTSLHHPQDPKVKLTVPKQKTETESETQAVPSPPPRLLLLPPPPPPIPPSTIWRPDEAVKKEGKKSSAKREIAMVWASIYKRKKKQNQPEQQQQLGREDSGNYNGISQLFCEPEFTSTTQLCPYPSPPPPPLPPPPHSVLHSFFQKTGSNKSKKIHSVPTPPPPPPPLPRQSFITQVTPRPRSSTGKPPPPKRPSSYRKDEYRYASSSGSESTVAGIPRPPPLPPFGVPETRFVVRGGLARMGKNSSWRNGEMEEVGEFEGESLAMEWSGGESASPDVNAKAETFIARLRGEWRLEKLNDT